MPITSGMRGSSYLCSQITGGVENAVPLRIDIPCTCGRGFDLSSEDALQEYLKLAVPGHALLWLSLVKWKRKKRESTRF
jgi:hypothetical protein